MNRIYHTWDKWECYPAGFYENKPPQKDMTDDDCRAVYRDLLRDIPAFEAALGGVITQWKNSCEHYLTNENMNRIAWLGQASLCLAKGMPSVFRGGFNMLSPQEQERANEAALKFLNIWLERNGYPVLTMEDAMSKTEVNLY
jgi:hypothetical protein